MFMSQFQVKCSCILNILKFVTLPSCTLVFTLRQVMANQLNLANFWGKKRANSSNVWDHFGFRCDATGLILDKTKAVCKYCSAEVKYIGGNTSNLTSHYNTHHMQESKEERSTLQPSIRAALGATRKYARSSSHHIMLQQRVAEYLVADMRPFNTVGSAGFRKLCAALDPKFDLPGKTTFSNTVIPKMYKETKGKVQELIDKCSAIAITADGWTSVATESYITMTGHFLNDDWDLKTVALQTRHCPEHHTAENLKKLFEDAFKEWELTNKTILGVVDNARNITKAWTLLDKQVVNCFSHTMNLAVRKGLAAASMDNTLMKARKLVKHFHHSAVHSLALKNQQEMLNLPRQKLKMDVETRWNSTYDMIESILASKEAVSQVLIGDKTYRSLSLSPDDFTVLEEVKDILQPWKELTDRVGKESDVTISLIAPSLHKLLTKELQAKELDSELGAQIKSAMKTDLSKRYQENEVKLFLNVATLLDPRFKLLPFLSDEEKQSAHTSLEGKATQIEEKRAKSTPIKEEKTTGPPLPIPADFHHQGIMAETAPAAVSKVEPSSPTSAPPNKKQKLIQDNFFDDFFGDLIITKEEESSVN